MLPPLQNTIINYVQCALKRIIVSYIINHIASMCYNVLLLLLVPVQLILNCMVKIAYSIATFSNHILK